MSIKSQKKKVGQNEDVRLGILREVFDYDQGNNWVQLGVEGMDDAALIRYSDGQSLVMASDFVRGSGFDMFQSGHMDHFDVGYYLMAANISDIAAMGAKPICATTNLRYVQSMTNAQFQDTVRGIRNAADTYDVRIVGGDIGGYEANVFTATVLGIVETDRAIMRRGAKLGDLLCVTGCIGGAVSATAHFHKAEPAGLKLDKAANERLLDCWRKPTPQVQAGLLLSDHGLATSCMDVSDGLSSSVDTLSRASNVCFEVFAEALPLHPESSLIAEHLGLDLHHLVMSASVDFQLLFTIPPSAESLVAKLFDKYSIPWSVIGRASSTKENQFFVGGNPPSAMPGIRWNQQPNLFEEIYGEPAD